MMFMCALSLWKTAEIFALKNQSFNLQRKRVGSKFSFVSKFFFSFFFVVVVFVVIHSGPQKSWDRRRRENEKESQKCLKVQKGDIIILDIFICLTFFAAPGLNEFKSFYHWLSSIALH